MIYRKAPALQVNDLYSTVKDVLLNYTYSKPDHILSLLFLHDRFNSTATTYAGTVSYLRLLKQFHPANVPLKRQASEFQALQKLRCYLKRSTDVCKYLGVYVGTYVRTYVCMYVCMYVCIYVCMCVRTYVCYVCMNMYVCMYVCMCVCMYVYVCNVCMYV